MAIENKNIYEVGIHQQWWDEFNEDNWQTVHQLFTDNIDTAEKWFKTITERRYNNYQYQYSFIRKIELDKENGAIIIKKCNNIK